MTAEDRMDPRIREDDEGERMDPRIHALLSGENLALAVTARTTKQTHALGMKWRPGFRRQGGGGKEDFVVRVADAVRREERFFLFLPCRRPPCRRLPAEGLLAGASQAAISFFAGS